MASSLLPFSIVASLEALAAPALSGQIEARLKRQTAMIGIEDQRAGQPLRAERGRGYESKRNIADIV